MNILVFSLVDCEFTEIKYVVVSRIIQAIRMEIIWKMSSTSDGDTIGAMQLLPVPERQNSCFPIQIPTRRQQWSFQFQRHTGGFQFTVRRDALFPATVAISTSFGFEYASLVF